jgi:dihydroorotase
MTDLLITNARLVNEGETRDADVLIKGQRIEKVDSGLSAGDKVQVLDANGMLLLPGMIDDQVHFREPGLTNKGNLATESAAAVAGIQTCRGTLPRKLRFLSRRDQSQHRGNQGAGDWRGMWHQGVHGRVDRRHAGG